MKVLFKISVVIFLGVAMTISGCTPQEAETVESNISEQSDVQILRTTVESTTGVEKFTATLAVDGMGCAMACGSKISGALAGLDGVVKTDIDFKGAGESNSVIVEYDASKVSESSMIDAVNELKGGHYEVKSVAVIHHKPAGETPAANEDSKKEKVSAIAPKLQYELPNIFSVFSRLF
ncbi:MAG: heavy-metal-associated domain-containing protein [Cryomorphaceae bacterium]|nr:hypothetical protein [Flavobacteriales bacterium]